METSRHCIEFEVPIFELEEKIKSLKDSVPRTGITSGADIKSLEETCERLKTEIYGNLTPWQRVLLARHPRRPYFLDYVPFIFSDFTELRGDRCFADDKAVVAALATIDGKSCAVIGQQKGRTLDENLARNYGMAHPEGYRKALRIMKLAEKFRLPLLTFIDTPGAYPGIGAEERGQAEAIARNLKTMSSLKIPVIATVIGEGGSGGALGIGVADRIVIMENAYYSVITPEGCSAILFKDSRRAPEAAAALKITASDLMELSIADAIVPEPLGGADKDPSSAAAALKKVLLEQLASLSKIPFDKLPQERYKKYRVIGSAQKTKSEGRGTRGTSAKKSQKTKH
ncbi:MAG: acetyl-CoA carboxylase carboxyl transferase subunit alpha [Elusimicrobia bacterium HGW-Elusimicrobia-1]|jgi:acetyl-CoA carboxylase carboxyl transferase subunit alpha|nr:MAG: acetyl-CoA carboxylase carboxyl transferase subunit alpha [Elusimicrobia bacterium HGW-Elusimicrobia-1]